MYFFKISIPDKNCLVECSSHGSCNFEIGLCQCDEGYYGDSCEENTTVTRTETTTEILERLLDETTIK